ncbi:MAG: YbhB/YbcL family Raf kinase inhibitor-like protein, partial [Polyangiaceae bacterium]|nr:YbhB/YbcL family Raf kinase inhibitor-like protein [Polyangiaceae bacterium]
RAGDETLASAGPFSGPSLTITTPSFPNDGPMPSRHAGDHNVSPPLAWSGAPKGTRELALLVEDPDAPLPQAFVHWMVYGISPALCSLPEGIGIGTKLPRGVAEGRNSTGRSGFVGPKPPRGHGVHHYHFQLFALDEPLGIAPGAERDALVLAMKGHVLARGELVGTYEIR